MQLETQKAFEKSGDIMLLSPTGTGKTLAFLLPIVAGLKTTSAEIQTVIVVPSRELALQIEQVIREMGTGFKANAVYGGRAFNQDKLDLKHPPAILVGTPGRIADHLRRGTFDTKNLKTLVLDEFDKSLEIGFEDEMRHIISALGEVKMRVLTSATKAANLPSFLALENLNIIDHSKERISELQVKTIVSPKKDKLETLAELLQNLGNQPGIVFCNFKETIDYVSDFLTEKGISHGCFFGGMEQKDRERSLIKFRNGSNQIIIATDLAARGLDIPELKFIIHYHLPQRSQEFTHRNGRTARMHTEGTAYILKWVNEELPSFIESEIVPMPEPQKGPKKAWRTLFISGGRRDKISKGDIAGLFLKQGNLEAGQLGAIEIKQDCAFVAVDATAADAVMAALNNSRLKTKKVRVTEI